MSVAALGEALTWLGGAGCVAWLVADVRRGGRELRRAGRAALVGPRAAARALRHRRYPPADRCAASGHRPSWDGLYETCRRCGASSRPWASLDDPRAAASATRRPDRDHLCPDGGPHDATARGAWELCRRCGAYRLAGADHPGVPGYREPWYPSRLAPRCLRPDPADPSYPYPPTDPDDPPGPLLVPPHPRVTVDPGGLTRLVAELRAELDARRDRARDRDPPRDVTRADLRRCDHGDDTLCRRYGCPDEPGWYGDRR